MPRLHRRRAQPAFELSASPSSSSTSGPAISGHTAALGRVRRVAADAEVHDENTVRRAHAARLRLGPRLVAGCDLGWRELLLLRVVGVGRGVGIRALAA